MPERDIESLGVMGWGLAAAENSPAAVAAVAVVAVPPQVGLVNYRFPLFSDTYERSGRATGCYRLVMTLRFFLVFMKLCISSTNKSIF